MHVTGVSKEERMEVTTFRMSRKKKRDMCPETRIAMKVLSRENKNIHPNIT